MVIASLLLTGLFGCESSTPVVPEPPAAASMEAVAPPATGFVQVAEAGTRYEPAAAVEQIPDGAWMCDMGTVHYAAGKEGSCPVCGMNLIEKKAAPAAAEGEPEADDEPHGH